MSSTQPFQLKLFSEQTGEVIPTQKAPQGQIHIIFLSPLMPLFNAG